MTVIISVLLHLHFKVCLLLWCRACKAPPVRSEVWSFTASLETLPVLTTSHILSE